jgi:glycerol dehydrogenase
LTGVGAGSCGLAAAHALHNGLSSLPHCHGAMHGEKVAFATVVQLILEDDYEEAERAARFNAEVRCE